jgi:putative oxidoreductase
MAWTRGAWALPLRLIFGFGMMFHSFPKLFSTEGHANFVGTLAGLGIPAPAAAAWIFGLVEFVGGFMLLIGAFVTVVSLVLIVDLLLFAVLMHGQYGFNFMNITGITESGALVFGMPGYEVNLLYIAALLALAIGGAGSYSVDERRGVGRIAEPAPA